MGAEDLNQAFVLGAVFFQPLELVAAGTEGPGGRVAQGGDGRVAVLARIDEVLREGADDAVTPGVDLAYAAAVLARGLYDAAGAGVDDGGDAPGLGVEYVFDLGHALIFPSLILRLGQGLYKNHAWLASVVPAVLC